MSIIGSSAVYLWVASCNFYSREQDMPNRRNYKRAPGRALRGSGNTLGFRV